MEENRLDDWARKWRRYWFIYRAILLTVGVGVIYVFHCNFELGMISLAFAVYSWFWYCKGFYDLVVDEYEEGYPSVGFRWMLKSWFWLMVIIAIVGACIMYDIFCKIVCGIILCIFVLAMLFPCI